MRGNEIYVEISYKVLKRTSVGNIREDIKTKKFKKVTKLEYNSGMFYITYIDYINRNNDSSGLTEWQDCYMTKDIINLKVFGN